MDKLLLTIEEAADQLSIGRTKAYELVGTGRLETVSIGRCRRVPVQALAEFVRQLREPSTTGPNSGTLASGRSRATSIRPVPDEASRAPVEPPTTSSEHCMHEHPVPTTTLVTIRQRSGG